MWRTVGDVKCIAVIECYWTKLQSVTFPAFIPVSFFSYVCRDEAQTYEWRFLSRTERSEQTGKVCPHRHKEMLKITAFLFL